MLDNNKINILKKLNEKEKKAFLEIINQRIKPEEVEFKNKFKLFSKKPNGLDIIKNVLKDAKNNLNYEKVYITYLAAGKYRITIKHEDLKSADKLFSKFKNFLEKESKIRKFHIKFEE